MWSEFHMLLMIALRNVLLSTIVFYEWQVSNPKNASWSHNTACYVLRSTLVVDEMSRLRTLFIRNEYIVYTGFILIINNN